MKNIPLNPRQQTQLYEFEQAIANIQAQQQAYLKGILHAADVDPALTYRVAPDRSALVCEEQTGA